MLLGYQGDLIAGFCRGEQAQVNLVELLDYAFQACRERSHPRKDKKGRLSLDQAQELLGTTLLLIQAVRSLQDAGCMRSL